MRIDFARFDPDTGYTFIVASGTGVLEACHADAVLRCGAHRFVVQSVVSDYPEQPMPTVGLLVSSNDPPTEGMVFHPAHEPLTDEELAAAVQLLLMIPRMLKGIDSHGIARRLLEAKEPHHSLLVTRLYTFAEGIAKATDNCPPLDVFVELERYKAEILKAC